MMLAAVAASGFIMQAAQTAAQRPPQTGGIIRLDPALDSILPPGTNVERIYQGSNLMEGPLWTRDGSLLFSDMAANTIARWSADGSISIFIRRAGYDGDVPQNGGLVGSNGLTFDRDGRLIVCERGNRRLTRREPGG